MSYAKSAHEADVTNETEAGGDGAGGGLWRSQHLSLPTDEAAVAEGVVAQGLE